MTVAFNPGEYRPFGGHHHGKFIPHSSAGNRGSDTGASRENALDRLSAQVFCCIAAQRGIVGCMDAFAIGEDLRALGRDGSAERHAFDRRCVKAKAKIDMSGRGCGNVIGSALFERCFDQAVGFINRQEDRVLICEAERRKVHQVVVLIR